MFFAVEVWWVFGRVELIKGCCFFMAGKLSFWLVSDKRGFD
jgi:hypothetical protein